MAYVKLVLVRHAQSDGNVQKVMEGQGSTALSARGRQQAQLLSSALAAAAVLPTHLYSSPLLRAQQTATEIAAALRQINHAFLYQETAALQELHPGIFQGLTWPQAQAKYPDLCAQLMATLTWQPIPEAESPTTARQRAKSWFKHILESHAAGDVVWAVSHEGFLQHLISVVMGCDRTWQIRIAHTAIFEFWLFQPTPDDDLTYHESLQANRFNSAFWMLRRFNDCHHLN